MIRETEEWKCSWPPGFPSVSHCTHPSSPQPPSQASRSLGPGDHPYNPVEAPTSQPWWPEAWWGAPRVPLYKYMHTHINVHPHAEKKKHDVGRDTQEYRFTSTWGPPDPTLRRFDLGRWPCPEKCASEATHIPQTSVPNDTTSRALGLLA